MRKVKLLLRGVAVTALALALAVPGTVTPARAEDGGGNANLAKFVELVIDAFKKGSDGGYSPAEIIEMVENIINAVNGAKADVLSGLDGKVSAQIYSQMQAAITKVPNLKVPFLRGVAINSIHDAAYLAKGQITQSYPDAAKDAIGRALIALFTTLNTAYIQVDAEQIARGVPSNIAGFNRPYFRQGLEDLLRAVVPACDLTVPVPEAAMSRYTCHFADKTVYAETWGMGTYTINGGLPIPGNIDFHLIEDMTMKDTVRPIAQQTLDELKRENVPLP